MFVALKHAPSAMSKTHEATGKLHGGGSIILTGSSKNRIILSVSEPVLLPTNSAAGMRGGLGPMECEFNSLSPLVYLLISVYR